MSLEWRRRNMAIIVRPMRADEARVFLEIHRRSVRGLARLHYGPEVIDAWSPPITEERLAAFLKNRDDEIRLLAEVDGESLGLGALVAANSELRAWCSDVYGHRFVNPRGRSFPEPWAGAGSPTGNCLPEVAHALPVTDEMVG